MLPTYIALGRVLITRSLSTIGCRWKFSNCFSSLNWSNFSIERRNPKLKQLETSVFRSESSVTGFGKNSPLWQNLKSLWQYFEGLFNFWHNLEFTLANIECHWASLHLCKSPNISEQSSSHLVTLVQTKQNFNQLFVFRFSHFDANL